MRLSDTQKRLFAALLVILSVLIFDQWLKIWIKTHFYLGQTYYMFGTTWFQIHFIENYGMAFGMQFAGEYGKIILSVFRLLAIIAIGWYIYTLIKKKASIFLITVISLIFTGALGNLIDSAFYGLIFSESTPFNIATLFPPEGGYSSFLHGKVVDMFYFPLFTIHFPDWFPFWKGETFTFFEPVFNIADASITTGVFILIIFQKKLFKKETPANTTENNDQQPQGK